MKKISYFLAHKSYVWQEVAKSEKEPTFENRQATNDPTNNDVNVLTPFCLLSNNDQTFGYEAYWYAETKCMNLNC